MIQSYKNIPRQLVEFKDGGLVLRNAETTVTTRSLLILGTAKDGPTDPVAIDINTAEYIYGKDVNANGVPNGATIPKAIAEAYKAGCRDIRAMRISGEKASAALVTTSRSVTQQVKLEETLGFAEGNAITDLVLANTNVVDGTIRVFIRGTLLSATTTYTSGTNTLSIPADVCDAGANVTVRYDYNKTETDKAITEALTLNSSKKITLAYTPKGVTLKLYNGATLLTLTTDYTVSGKEVTFVNLTAGTIVQAQYSADVTTVVSVSESGTAGSPFKTATATQTFTLAQIPIIDAFHLYADDGEVLTADAYTLNAATKTLIINKERFAKGMTISVSYFYSASITKQESINFSSVFAGTVYNDGYITVSDIVNKDSVVIGKKVAITKPDSKRAANEAALEYSSINYPSFSQLISVINSDVRNGIYKASTDYTDTPTSGLVSGKYIFNGGDDGLNLSKAELFEKLSGTRDAQGYIIKEGAYQLLENYSVDYVALAGIYADDELPGKFDNFAYELALYCAVVSHQNKATYGYIDMIPCSDTSLLGVSNYASNLTSFNPNGTLFLMKTNGKIYTDGSGNTMDLGKFVRVVGGPEPLFMSDTLGVHYAYPSVALAAFQTTLKPQSSPTNKKITGSKGLRYRFSKPQLDKITGANIITFMQKFDNRGNLLEGAYVVDSMTCAKDGSDYERTTTCEVIRTCIDDVREVSDPFLGEPTTVEQKNALTAAIAKRLGIRKDEGVILDYVFQIVASAQDNILGKCKIELTLVPPQELREITTVVGLSPTL